jgi:choline dehydrogenase
VRVVVCGAGTAGCVLAARLSEEPGLEVVLLEAGPHYRPGRWPAELAHSHRIVKESHDWGYLARAGASPRLVHVPRGRVVGGSSATNGAIALRGHPDHYEEWEAYAPGWGWASWLPWFRHIERDLDFPEAPWHGAQGPITVSRYARPGWLPLQARFYEAALALGAPEAPDHNAPGALGVGAIPLNMRDGVRQTPADHYLDPALGRANLRLESGVTVDRVTLEGGRAVAVEGLDRAGRPTRWAADAVLLCLGTYATPACLLRSGVGPEEELRRHAIPTLHRLDGVGRGMQDHPKISYRFDLVELAPPPWPAPWYQVLLSGTVPGPEGPRIFQVMPYNGVEQGGQRFTDLNVQLSDARSRRGTVRLASRDPRAQPALEMGWLLEDGDRAAARAAGERLLALAATPPLREALRPWPNQADADHALRTVETFHHPAGSCRMGPSGDPGAVVDAGGAVHGLPGVWCADASIVPRVPSANIHLCVIALAERLAAGLRATWGSAGAPATATPPGPLQGHQPMGLR